tara:strand:- start:31 stop:201 length:171 start_codon:yes stop_codon:yes gene_type:complete
MELKEVKPDEKLLTAVRVMNEKIAENTKYRKEAPTFNDRSATSSDTLIEDLQNGQK